VAENRGNCPLTGHRKHETGSCSRLPSVILDLRTHRTSHGVDNFCSKPGTFRRDVVAASNSVILDHQFAPSVRKLLETNSDFPPAETDKRT